MVGKEAEVPSTQPNPTNDAHVPEHQVTKIDVAIPSDFFTTERACDWQLSSSKAKRTKGAKRLWTHLCALGAGVLLGQHLSGKQIGSDLLLALPVVSVVLLAITGRQARRARFKEQSSLRQLQQQLLKQLDTLQNTAEMQLRVQAAQIQRLQRTLQQVGYKLSTDSQRMMKQVDDAKADCQRLKTQLVAANSEITRMRGELGTKTSEMGSLQRQVSTYKQQVQRMQQQLTTSSRALDYDDYEYD